MQLSSLIQYRRRFNNSGPVVGLFVLIRRAPLGFEPRQLIVGVGAVAVLVVSGQVLFNGGSAHADPQDCFRICYPLYGNYRVPVFVTPQTTCNSLFFATVDIDPDGVQGLAGPQGAQGPAGPQGDPGPTGPAGGINNLQYIHTTSDSNTLVKDIVLSCPGGSNVIGGGFNIVGSSEPWVLQNGPDNNGTAWHVRTTNTHGNAWVLKVYAICASHPCVS